MAYGIPAETYRVWEPCEKYEAQAFYCPWCNTLIEGCWAWNAKKSLGLHLSDRGVWESCPARKTQPSGRVVTRWGTRDRFGIYPVRPRRWGCGREISILETSSLIQWNVYCDECAAAMMRPGVVAQRGRTSMRYECGDFNCSVYYEPSHVA